MRNFYAIVRTLIRDRNRDVSPSIHDGQLPPNGSVHGETNQHTVGDTADSTRYKQTHTAGTANSPSKADLPDFQTKKAHQTPRTSRRSRHNRQSSPTTHQTQKTHQTHKAQARTSRLKRHSKRHRNHQAGQPRCRLTAFRRRMLGIEFIRCLLQVSDLKDGFGECSMKNKCVT